MEKKREELSPKTQSESSTGIRLLEEQGSGIRAGGNGDMMSDKRQKLTEATHVIMAPIEEGSNGRLVAEGEFGRCDVPTQNGRIYPRKLMDREIERLDAELKERGVLGELDHPCLTDDDWRVFTVDGWKAFRDIKVGDKVWSRKDGFAVASEVTGIVDEPYQGDVYRVLGRGIDATFTPAHRLLLEKRPDRGVCRQELVAIADIVSSPVKYGHYAIPKTAKWLIDDGAEVSIPAADIARPNSAVSNVGEPLVLDEMVYAGFMGIYLSEGCCSSDSVDNYNVVINQTTEWSKKYVFDEILSRFPSDVVWRERPHGYEASDARLYQYLKPLGDVYSKHFPREAQSLSPAACQELVFWYAIGDGRMVYSNAETHRVEAGESVGKRVISEKVRGGDNPVFTRQDVFSVSKRLIDDLHACVVKTGGACSLSTIVSDKDYVFAGRTIKAENKSPLYQLHLSHSRNIWTDQRFLSFEKIQHDGSIYCLSVSGGNFYMEKNGNSFWTGNSDGKTSLKRISHVITGLRIEDDGRVIGRCEILNTKMGKELRALIEAKVKVGVSSRGYGSTAPARGQAEGEEVQEDFVLKTYDFVADPAMKTAIPEYRTEDVDGDEEDKSLAEMFLDEFPDVAQALTEGKNISCELTEGKDAKEKQTRKEIEEQVRAEMSENVERQLRDAMVSIREEVAEEIREEFQGDPDVAGAKGVLAAIAEMVGVYRQTPDEKAVADAIKEKELEVAEAKRERDEVAELGQKVSHELVIEREIGSHPMRDSIRKLLKGKTFESAEEARESVRMVISELPDADEVVSKEEAKIREENAELKGKYALLESKVDELKDKVGRVHMLNERIDEQRVSEIAKAKSLVEEAENRAAEAESKVSQAEAGAIEDNAALRQQLAESEMRVYKLERVAGLPNGRELLGLMESVSDRAVVDELVKKRGVTEIGDPNLRAVRDQVARKKGQHGESHRIEEDAFVSLHRNDLGHNMDEIAALAGIPRKG